MGELPKPVMVFSLAEYLADEMQARRWTAVDVAKRMPGDYGLNVLIVNFTLAITDEKLLMTDDLAEGFADAFNVSPDLFHNLHQKWVDHPEARQPFKCPDHLFTGLEPMQ